jgi:peptidoglycan/xylan/chitin deacetylase (PgdA/CDA1 family)
MRKSPIYGGRFHLNSAPKVLMYHGIYSKTTLCPPWRETGAELYDVSVERFRSHMLWLKQEGYTTDLESSSEKKVVITFDDGEMNGYREAWPILKEAGFKATFFIIVKRIGRNGYMGWKELKELLAAGMKVGSHGLTHNILTNLMDSQIEEELEGSKRTLEINLNSPIEEISIPRGFCNDKIIDKAHQLGYKRVYISDKPYHVQSACLTRIAVKRNWSLKRLKLAMRDQVPISESMALLLKKGTKTVLTENGYNFVRSMVLRIVL